MSNPGPPIGWNLDGPSSGVSKSKKKSKDKKKRKEKRRSSSSSSSDSSSSSSDERHKKGKKYSKLRDGKLKKPKKDKKSKKLSSEPDFGVPIHLMHNRATAPETQESWQARQNVIRRVVDPSTGRERLIRGDGEVLEEMVSRDRHRDINRQATEGDGQFFQANTVGWSAPKQ